MATDATLVLAIPISYLHYNSCFLTEFPIVFSPPEYIYHLCQLGYFTLEVTENQENWHTHYGVCFPGV